MFGKKKSNNKKFLDAVIINDERESVDALRKKAKHANTKFWGLAVSMGMVSSLVLPYMSMAAVAPKSTNVFTGQVVPGYSMGGVTLAAYGVDVNSWGNIESTSKVVGSNYGVWSGKRLESAAKNVETTSTLEKDEENLSNVDRAAGWQGITGRMAYTQSNPDGIDSTNVSNQYDSVAPYRTLSDYNYWDKRMLESNGAASASVNVSLFADFIIVSFDEEGNVHVLDSPDQVNTDGTKRLVEKPKEDGPNTQGATTATPYYIPISALMGDDDGHTGYELTSSKEASISKLMEKIGESKDFNTNVTKFKQVCSSAPNLLEGTKYTNVNGGIGESTAFNPYPYSMVFSMATDNGEVVSSIYNNAEAYVYFSPSSVYNQYIALRTEYERLRNNAASSLKDKDSNGKVQAQDPVTVFQMGYYLAEMSILEAYLDEALPQDMTRGYVGPTEASSLIGNATTAAGTTTVEESDAAQKSIVRANQAEDLNGISYVSLMYDFSYCMGSDGRWETARTKWRQTETDAIMDTLSTFGYFRKNDWDNNSDPGTFGTGIMNGMSANYALKRPTIFGNYQKAGDEQTKWDYSGIYVPTYYPIQQHKMPDSEKLYRFQILSAVPYETLLEYIKTQGFSNEVKFAFGGDTTGEGNSGLESFAALTVTKARDKLATLADRYEQQEDEGEKLDTLGTVDASQLSVFSGGTSVEGGLAARIDSALLGYNSSTMNSDNVHDLFDVVRATKNLKYETWIRFYNPIKSSGGDNDLFITRVSPALTTYFPAILVNGYTPAGGAEIDASLTPYGASFDYFSIPSFAPCFAAHTADTSYYGILNYELRPFYAKSFIETLSKSANVPAVEAKEAAKEAKEQMESEQKDEAYVTNQNLACLYVLSKRVAYANTIRDMANKATISRTDLIDLLESFCTNLKLTKNLNSINKNIMEGKDTQSDSEIAQQLQDVGTNLTNSSTQGAGKGIIGKNLTTFSSLNFVPNKGGNITPAEAVDTNVELYQLCQNGIIPETIKLVYADEYPDKIWGAPAGYKEFASASGAIKLKAIEDISLTAGEHGAFFWKANAQQVTSVQGVDGDDCGKNWTKVGHIYGANDFTAFNHGDDNTAVHNGAIPIIVSADETNGYTCVPLPTSYYFTILYNKNFDRIFNKYHWVDDYWEIRNMIVDQHVEPKAESTEIGWDATAETELYETRFVGDTLQNIIKDTLGYDAAQITFEQVIEALEAQIDLASDQIAVSIINLIKDYELLTKTMPSKMQNCLAWADYQNSSDSEAQYQVDPSNANVIISVGDGQQNGQTVQPQHIRSKEEAIKYSLNVEQTDDGFTITNQNATDENGLGLEGRLERGVEGSTWTSTVHPALYTMSATIARVTGMSTQTGTVYPYSGLANGRLQSGTDKYAVMQSHVIDYTSIASGIAGDLSTRTRAQVVSLVEPQYASIDSFTDILNIIGAFFGEAGTAMVQGAASMFSSVMFPSDQGTEVATSANQNGVNAASSTMSYMMHDGSTMNRTPASLATFNPNTGKLEYGTVINNTSSNYIVNSSFNSANAAGNSGMALMAGDTVLGPLANVYKIVQTFGLTFVMIFIGFIAFKNFFAYTSGDARGMLGAQIQLKTVLWRSIVAVFMIGLPPLGGTGFEGGNFVVLEVLSNVMGFIEGIFIGDNGSALMSIFTNVNLFESFGINFFAWILFFICCAVIALCFLIGTLLVWLLNMFLLVFFLFGPLVWAFYVWPYADTSTGADTNGKTDWKQYMNLGFLSGGAVGNLMPKGHIRNFVVFSLIGVAWGLLFWFVAQIFVIGSGISYTDTNPSDAATLMASASGYSTASMAISSATAGLDLFGIPTGMGAEIRLLITTVVCVIVFALMAYLLIKAFVNQMRYTRGLGRQIGQGILNGIQKADEKINGVAEYDKDGNYVGQKGGLRNKVQAAADAAKIMKHGSLADADKSKKLKKAGKMLSRGNFDAKALPDDMKKFLEDEGLAEGLDLTTDAGKKALGERVQAKKQVQENTRKENLKKMRAGLDNTIDPKTGKRKKGLARAAGMLANAGTAAKLAQNFGKAADNSNFLEAFAQTANTLNASTLDREKQQLDKEGKILENAKIAADKLLEDGTDVDATLKGLDEETWKKLSQGPDAIAHTDEKTGKRVLNNDGKTKAKQLSSSLDDKLTANRNKILAKQKEKDDFSSRLEKMGLAKDKSIQECTKVLRAGYDNQMAQEVIKEHNFTGDGTMTAQQQAREYMKGGDYTKKIDNKEAAEATAARLLDFDPNNLDADQRRAVEKYVAGAPAMESLCGISKLRSAEEKQQTLSAGIQGVVDSIDTATITSPTAKMEAVRMACGAPVPSLVEQPAILSAVADGTATAYQYQQYAALQANNIVNGRPMTQLPEPIRGAALASDAINESLANVSAMQVAQSRIANGVNGKPADLGTIGKFATNDGISTGITQAIMSEAKPGGALDGYSEQAVQQMVREASRLVDPMKSAEENLATFSNLGGLSSMLGNIALSTPDGEAAQKGFAMRANAQQVVAQREEQYAAASELVADAERRLEALRINPDGLSQSELAEKTLVIKQEREAALAEQAREMQVLEEAKLNLETRIAETESWCHGFNSLEEYKREMVSDVSMCVMGGATMSAMQGYSTSVDTDSKLTSEIYASTEVGGLYAEHLMDKITDPTVKAYVESSYTSGMSMDALEKSILDNLPKDNPMACYELQSALNSTKNSFAHSDEALNAMTEIVSPLSDEQIAAYKMNVAADTGAVRDVASYIGRDDILVRAENPTIADCFEQMKTSGELTTELNPEFVSAVEKLSNGKTLDDIAATCDKAISDGKISQSDAKRVMGVYEDADKLLATMHTQGIGDALYGNAEAQAERARMSRRMEGKKHDTAAQAGREYIAPEHYPRTQQSSPARQVGGAAGSSGATSQAAQQFASQRATQRQQQGTRPQGRPQQGARPQGGPRPRRNR